MLKYTRKDFKVVPWKNGGGTTLELFKLSHPPDENRFLLRFSIAKVEKNGLFSNYDLIDRHLILLKGNGMRLSFPDGKEVVLKLPFQQIEFKGEESIQCDLITGPTEDFNVMVARDWGKAHVSHLHYEAGQEINIDKGQLVFVYLFQSQDLLELRNESYNQLSHETTDILLVKIQRF